MGRTTPLPGKAGLVSGGGRGIGKAIARRLADAGAAGVVARRKRENLEAAASELAGLPGTGIPIARHLGRAEQGEALVRESESRDGPGGTVGTTSATHEGQ